MKHRQTRELTDRQTDRQRQRENSERYYTMIKILGSCLFLQSVPANLHANRLHIKVRERQTDRQTDRHRDTDTDRQTDVRGSN